VSKKNIELPGSFFAYHDISRIHGKVLTVITKDRRTIHSPILDKGFSFIIIDEGCNKGESAVENVVTVAMDNEKTPPDTITGDNSIEGKTVIIESGRIIIIKN
jgi:hypothetical protein